MVLVDKLKLAYIIRKKINIKHEVAVDVISLIISYFKDEIIRHRPIYIDNFGIFLVLRNTPTVKNQDIFKIDFRPTPTFSEAARTRIKKNHLTDVDFRGPDD